jgi:hypothetical protein
MDAYTVLTAVVIDGGGTVIPAGSLPGYWTLTTSRTLYTSIA